jgi:ADP-ribosylglycohydrolase
MTRQGAGVRTAAVLTALLCWGLAAAEVPTRQISYREYYDKAQGGWLGKVSGLTLGVPREFSETWPPSNVTYFGEVPDHFSDLYSGDDLYFPLLVQICLKKYGPHPTYEQYMHEWAARLYSGRIWGANSTALEHYWAGIMPPKTGSPGYNSGSRDIDAQIDFDPAGWVAPGLINQAAEIADHGGHIMCAGDGVDAGVFIAAALSEAFFTSDMEQLIRRAESVLPQTSGYRHMIDDVLRWHSEQPDWRVTRQLLARKYSSDLIVEESSAVINGGAVLIGLLYGDKDFGKTVITAMHCGWDSDCNAATSGGILGTMLGASKIDARWSQIFHDSYENYCLRDLPRRLRISDIARDTVEIGETVVRQSGGQVSGAGEERIFTIPIEQPRTLTRNELYSEELIRRNRDDMRAYYREKLRPVTRSWEPEWQLTMASFENPPEVLADYFGRQRVLRAQPDRGTGVTLERTVTLAAGKHHYLRVGVAHHATIQNEQIGRPEIGRWKLEVQANGRKIGEFEVYTQGGLVVWEDPQFDLTAYAGQTVRLSLIGRDMTSDIEFYMASQSTYWSDARIISLDEPESWR